MSSSVQQLLWEGISDAAGFVVGALIGYGVGQGLGWDLFAPGYGTASLLGIACIGIGAGLGLRLVRHWRIRRQPPAQS